MALGPGKVQLRKCFGLGREMLLFQKSPGLLGSSVYKNAFALGS